MPGDILSDIALDKSENTGERFGEGLSRVTFSGDIHERYPPCPTRFSPNAESEARLAAVAMGLDYGRARA